MDEQGSVTPWALPICATQHVVWCSTTHSSAGSAKRRLIGVRPPQRHTKIGRQTRNHHRRGVMSAQARTVLFDRAIHWGERDLMFRACSSMRILASMRVLAGAGSGHERADIAHKHKHDWIDVSLAFHMGVRTRFCVCVNR